MQCAQGMCAMVPAQINHHKVYSWSDDGRLLWSLQYNNMPVPMTLTGAVFTILFLLWFFILFFHFLIWFVSIQVLSISGPNMC